MNKLFIGTFAALVLALFAGSLARPSSGIVRAYQVPSPTINAGTPTITPRGCPEGGCPQPAAPRPTNTARPQPTATTAPTLTPTATPMGWVPSPTARPTATSTASATATRTATATSTASATATRTATATSTATATPTLKPTLTAPTFDDCREQPAAALAPEHPVRIVDVDKVAESVVLQNTTALTISLEGWHMCSLRADQEHAPIGGQLAPGETRVFVSGWEVNIWRNDLKDDGALYDATGRLVSYWNDPEMSNPPE